MKKLKILITGGAGYIGSKLSTKLVLMNFKVTVLDNLSYSETHLIIFFHIKILILLKEMSEIKIY